MDSPGYPEGQRTTGSGWEVRATLCRQSHKVRKTQKTQKTVRSQREETFLTCHSMQLHCTHRQPRLPHLSQCTCFCIYNDLLIVHCTCKQLRTIRKWTIKRSYGRVLIKNLILYNLHLTLPIKHNISYILSNNIELNGYTCIYFVVNDISHIYMFTWLYFHPFWLLTCVFLESDGYMISFDSKISEINSRQRPSRPQVHVVQSVSHTAVTQYHKCRLPAWTNMPYVTMVKWELKIGQSQGHHVVAGGEYVIMLRHGCTLLHHGH